MTQLNDYLLFVKFFQINKFPSFEETVNIISQKASVDINTVWNSKNYSNMQLCWDSIDNVENKDFIRKAGINIYNKGAFRAMFHSLQAFLFILETIAKNTLSNNDTEIIKSIAKHRISLNWNGIGSWLFYPDKSSI